MGELIFDRPIVYGLSSVIAMFFVITMMAYSLIRSALHKRFVNTLRKENMQQRNFKSGSFFTDLAGLELIIPEPLSRAFDRAGLADFRTAVVNGSVGVALIGLGAFLFAGYSVLGVIFFFGTLIAAIVFVFSQVKVRRNQMHGQLPEMLDHLAQSIDSGLSLIQSIQRAAEALDGPMADELNEIHQTIQYGSSLSQALEMFDAKWKMPAIHRVCKAILIQQAHGGNMRLLLMRASAQLRDSARLEKALSAQTAQGRLSMRLIVLAPVVLLVALGTLVPGLIEPLVQTSYGHLILISSCILELLGVVWVKSILAIKVER